MSTSPFTRLRKCLLLLFLLQIFNEISAVRPRVKRTSSLDEKRHTDKNPVEYDKANPPNPPEFSSVPTLNPSSTIAISSCVMPRQDDDVEISYECKVEYNQLELEESNHTFDDALSLIDIALSDSLQFLFSDCERRSIKRSFESVIVDKCDSVQTTTTNCTSIDGVFNLYLIDTENEKSAINKIKVAMESENVISSHPSITSITCDYPGPPEVTRTIPSSSSSVRSMWIIIGSSFLVTSLVAYVFVKRRISEEDSEDDYESINFSTSA